MRVRAVSFTGFLCCLITAPTPPAYANLPLEVRANVNLSDAQLLGESSVSTLSADVLLGVPAHTRQRPSTSKKWTPTPVSPRSVSTLWSFSSNRNSAIAQTPAPARSSAVSVPSLPQFSSQSLGLAEAQADVPGSVDSVQDEIDVALLESLTNDVSSELTSETSTEIDQSTIAQSLPSLESIQQIQRDLRELDIPTLNPPRRSVYPGITISNPTGYGADNGQIFAGVGFQSRTRFSGGPNPGTIFGGGRRDGTAGIGFGIGDARKSVGLQISYTAASFGGSRAPLSGGLNAKVHKQFGNGWAAAVGGEGIINFGRLPEDDDQIEFNDFEGTYYGVVSKTFALREDFYSPFSALTLTAGAGTGRFRSVDQIANGEFGVGPFGSAALQVLPSTNLITEWTGQDLAVGVSVAPFRNFPIVFTPAIRDIAGEGDGNPRFVMGVGISLSDIFSKLGL